MVYFFCGFYLFLVKTENKIDLEIQNSLYKKESLNLNDFLSESPSLTAEKKRRYPKLHS
jgi:hypothetical protein